MIRRSAEMFHREKPASATARATVSKGKVTSLNPQDLKEMLVNLWPELFSENTQPSMKQAVREVIDEILAERETDLDELAERIKNTPVD
jgi:hypothetical protein